MNLPYITAKIGEQCGGDGPFESLYKNVKEQKDKDMYAVFLAFDIGRKAIYFDGFVPHSEDLISEYLYFGNNSAAGAQYYVVREAKSINYLIGSTLNDLKMELKKQGMEGSRLYSLISEIEYAGLSVNPMKKGDGRLNLEKWTISGQSEGVKLTNATKSDVEINGKKTGHENFVRILSGLEDRNKLISIVIPKIIEEDSREIIISKMQDYKDLVMRSNNLGLKVETKGQSGERGEYCYICKDKKPEVKSSEYFSKLDRTGINKIFTTTTINSSRDINQSNYKDNYAVCRECYANLMKGEKYINNNLTTRIAGERAFIIPEGVLGEFDYQYLKRLKKEVDMCFNPYNASEFMESIAAEFELENEKEGYYNLNFVINKTDGNSVNILEVLEDIPNFYFQRVNLSIRQNARAFGENMNLGSIYDLIPVKTSKTKEQLNIRRVLSVYKSIFNRQKLENNMIFSYACENLEESISKGKEFDAKETVFKYIALLKAFQELKLLERQEFIEGGIPKVKIEAGMNESTIEGMEVFLAENGFNSEASAAFYLGVLVKSVANAQYAKNHKSKPILNKIRFQGMNKNEIVELYTDIVEKLRQYEKMTIFNEMLMKNFHLNFGNINGKWEHRDQDNVFYIMSGYAYMTRSFDIKDKTEGDEGNDN